MTSRLVVDSSALVALLADAGPVGDWVAATTAGADLAAPELAPFETANILRRHQLSRRLTPLEATLAHDDLRDLPVQLWPYLPLAERAWALRENATAYDASYIALAELLGTSLVTLDTRLARSSGARCPVLAPPAPTS